MSQAQKGGGGDSSPDQEELLVFGYACKLFRDDDKALMIESGQHLIPWMGDDSLKIDRYDGRGALYDLATSAPESWEQLSYDELEMERMCDQERYRALNSEEEDHAAYQEEEMKRFYEQTGSYTRIGYVYEENAAPMGPEEESTVPGPPFVPPPQLDIPSEMTTPETMKLHAIIERTAVFIAQQGPQMEIIMKLKQNGNKQFDFLSHNDSLHPYYKHVLASIKSGAYTPAEEKEEQGDDAEDGHYLHPLLAAKPYHRPPTPTQEPPPPTNHPTDQTKKIIEKLVKYVARNGPVFESLILKRGEPRFSFLEPSHPHHSYYLQRLGLVPKSDRWAVPPTPATPALEPPPTVEKQVPVEIVEEKPPVEAVTREGPEVADNDSNSSEHSSGKSGVKRKPNPVCFSIKKAKENESLEVPSALPMEDSSDDNEGETPQTPPKAPSVEAPPPKADPPPEEPSKKQRRLSDSRKRKSRRKHKDAHIQKERKLKVAQFLKGLKTKQSP